jgi:putative tryptophan/tyrosine transport system substrate-binding protein
MTDVSDAVGMGLVQSLARPGGNITGSTFMAPQLLGKRLEILKEVLPGMRSVAFLVNPGNASVAVMRKEIDAAAGPMNVEVREFAARQPGDFEAAFQAMARDRINAVLVQEDSLFTVNTATLGSLAIRHKLPLAGFNEFASAGGLIGLGVNFPDLYRRAAYFVDRILKGAKPAELPVEQPTKFELIVNLRTAKALGIVVPRATLLRADRVID